MHNKDLFLTLFVGLLVSLRLPAPAIDPFAAMAEFDRITAVSWWPGFDPQHTPVEIYDGHATWLFRHPHPPAEFKESPENKNVFVAPGQHSSLRANTSIELGGVETATVRLENSLESMRAAAALIAHECFHVFQAQHHPRWRVNEVDLFIYPVDNADLLKWHLLEMEALERALLAENRPESACWAAEAVRTRKQRFASLPKNAIAYERGTELKEGLANYIQVRAAGREGSFRLAQSGLAADAVRQRAYQTGTAMGLVLDRIAPGWQEQMDSETEQSLDELLDRKTYSASGRCAYSEAEEASTLGRARAEIRAAQQERAKLKADFLAAKGWQILVISNPEKPLFPQAFDPWNVAMVATGEVLHRRWVKLSNQDGSIEVLDRASLSQAAGDHPLFNGVRQLTITGLSHSPVIQAKDSSIQIVAPGVSAEFHDALVHTEGQKIIVRLGQEAQSAK